MKKAHSMLLIFSFIVSNNAFSSVSLKSTLDQWFFETMLQSCKMAEKGIPADEIIALATTGLKKDPKSDIYSMAHNVSLLGSIMGEALLDHDKKIKSCEDGVNLIKRAMIEEKEGFY